MSVVVGVIVAVAIADVIVLSAVRTTQKQQLK
jgi:hypothetical protein